MNLSQQQQENKDSWRSTGDYTSKHLDLLDTLTSSTYRNAQEEMLERATAKILGYKTKDMTEYWGADRLKRVGYDIAIDDVVAALSSLRAGENETRVGASSRIEVKEHTLKGVETFGNGAGESTKP